MAGIELHERVETFDCLCCQFVRILVGWRLWAFGVLFSELIGTAVVLAFWAEEKSFNAVDEVL